MPTFDEAFRAHGALDVVCDPCGTWAGMFNLRRYTAEASAMLPPIAHGNNRAEMETAIERVKETLGESAYVPVADLIGEVAPFPCPRCGARFQLADVDGALTMRRIAAIN